MFKGILLLCSVGWQSVTWEDFQNNKTYCDFYETTYTFESAKLCTQMLEKISEEYLAQSEKGSAVFSDCNEVDYE